MTSTLKRSVERRLAKPLQLQTQFSSGPPKYTVCRGQYRSSQILDDAQVMASNVRRGWRRSGKESVLDRHVAAARSR